VIERPLSRASEPSDGDDFKDSRNTDNLTEVAEHLGAQELRLHCSDSRQIRRELSNLELTVSKTCAASEGNLNGIAGIGESLAEIS